MHVNQDELYLWGFFFYEWFIKKNINLYITNKTFFLFAFPDFTIKRIWMPTLHSPPLNSIWSSCKKWKCSRRNESCLFGNWAAGRIGLKYTAPEKEHQQAGHKARSLAFIFNKLIFSVFIVYLFFCLHIHIFIIFFAKPLHLSYFYFISLADHVMSYFPNYHG